MDTKKGINFLTALMRISVFIALIYSAIQFNWTILLISTLALVLTFLPNMIERHYSIDIPLDFEFLMIVFVYASLFLGEVNKFYELFWWWDILLHLISSIAFGIIGFIIIFFLNKTNRLSTKPLWIMIFTFAFSLSIGTIWEIFEFGMDQVFNLNMQKSGLVDTMFDLIFDSVGAFMAATMGYAFMRGNQKSYLVRLIKIFFKKNSSFKK